MNNSTKIDSMSYEDILSEVNRLAECYTPEWNFTTENPDIGSVIAMLFAKQFGDNIESFNRLYEKYHTEFINLQDLTLKPMTPATGVVTATLIDGIPDLSAVIPMGTKFLGVDAENPDENVIFEATADSYISDTKLKQVFQTSSDCGKIINVFGDAEKLSVIDFPTEENLELFETVPVLKKFRLFDFSTEGIELNGLLLMHKAVFDTDETGKIFINFISPQEGICPAEIFADKKNFTVSYYKNGGLKPFDSVSFKGDTLILERSENGDKIKVRQTEYSPIFIECKLPQEAIVLSDISISSEGDGLLPSFVYCDSDEKIDRFLPFSDTASLYTECYIGCSEVFSKAGAITTLTFDLKKNEKLVELSTQQVESSLKIIKKKPKSMQFDVANTCAERVRIEYFNGTGYKVLATEHGIEELFNGEHTGNFSISFTNPDDWQRNVSGGHEEYTIRLRLTKADNCYLRPCLHTMPIIENLEISYKYEGLTNSPQIIKRFFGGEMVDVSDTVKTGKSFTAFEPLPYLGENLFLGFNFKKTDYPTTLMLKISGNDMGKNAEATFYYSSTHGFKELKVTDETDGLTKSGIISFILPNDFAKIRLFGVNSGYLMIKSQLDAGVKRTAIIDDIFTNAIPIINIDTKPNEVFYIESNSPNVALGLASKNIKDTDVYVNEFSQHSVESMEKLLRTTPQKTRAERNFAGDITEFYIKWDEVENFANSTANDRHYILDRARSLVIFGDGVSVKIPKPTTDPAVIVTARTCSGSHANLDVGMINETVSHILYVDSITNPLPTGGSSDMETIETAHRRGANIICSKNRLISKTDFIREAYLFSSEIELVKCVTGIDIYGRKNPDFFSLVVMLKNSKSSGISFLSFAEDLKDHILSKCDISINEKNLFVVEPIFAKICLNVRLRAIEGSSIFAVKNHCKNEIDSFISRNFEMGAISIGRLVSEDQFYSVLSSLGGGISLLSYTATLQYEDESGSHETSLSGMANNRFVIGVSGEHTIIVEGE